MKPLNTDDPGCNYTTSNCVIWQGENIPCLNLCKGDTISDVTFKLATEVCNILDILKVDSYDLSCFNLTTCKPDDFKQLTQFILDRLCAVEKCSDCIPNCDGTTPGNTPTPGSSGCPDCVVAIASCFYYQNPLGDTVTSMQLQDYVTAIGNRICNNVQNITNQQKTLTNHGERITVLEDAPPAIYVPPTITPTCVLPPVPSQIEDVLTAVEQQFCQLQGATGNPNTLYQNISKQCAGLNAELALNGSGSTMASLSGWSSVVNTAAQSLGNMWLTICDMRQAIKTIQLNCCPTGCEGIELSMLAILDINILSVYVNGTIPTGFLECTGNTQIRVTDSAGGSATYNFNLVGYLNNPTGYPINLSGSPINTSLDLVIVIQPCLENSSIGSTCRSYLSYDLVNSSSCPTISFTATQTTIGYSFTSQLGDYTYNIQVWDNAGSTMISNQIQIISGIQTVSGNFTGLGIGTNYKVRLVIQPTACPECDPTVCPFTTVATNPPTCAAPNSVSSGLTVPVVYLGDACGFAAVAGSAISNTGTTNINGNLALDPGSSLTGAPTVTGSTHINDATAIAAKASLVDAYNQAAAATGGTDMTGIDLGGVTLTPGVYFFTSSAAITGTLILDGAGTYIFQIGTTLVTNGGINVSLINGATADQIFWQVGSSATLGTSTTFEGIIMTLTSITIDGGTVNGALMARNGALTITAGTDINYIGC